MPTTFVLVHGAWHGGWCWQRVADALRAQGHTVFAPTLTGLGERAHLMNADVNLSTHVADIVNVFKYERLDDVVLCGHSYGGFVISGVAEQCAPAIRSIVFLDAFVPNHGDSVEATTSQAVRQAIEAAKAQGGLGLPPRPAAFFKVNEKDQPWVDALCVPQPVACFTEKVALTGALEGIGKKSYIRARSYENPGFDHALTRVKADSSWRTYEVPCGHDVMVDAPERLTEILLEVA